MNRMFQRLLEGFESAHVSYISKQQPYFGSLPNMLPSGSDSLPLASAVQSVDTIAAKDGNAQYQTSPVDYPNLIVRNPNTSGLADLQSHCAAGSLDELIRAKNPVARVGCGWMYIPPAPNSPYPVLGKGALGNQSGPVPGMGNPDYRKWFFDLQEAKRVTLMDTCKALKTCEDVETAPYKGVCGFCMDTNQGIPIDKNGSPLYASNPRGNCSQIVLSRDKCPRDTPDQGPVPPTDRTCVPSESGNLSASCLHRQVLSAGCSSNGSLALALKSSNATDYIGSIRDGDVVKIYQRSANPPMNLDMFRQGQTTVAEVLREVGTIAGNAKQAASSALGASARDLCIQKGSIQYYHPCDDLPDGTISPFDLGCLQTIFRKMGGQPAGSAYPNERTIGTYNNMGNLGTVKQYWNQMIGNMKSADYNVQQAAISQILGIKLENAISRAPYKAGVEYFWFSANGWSSWQNPGTFLKRTVERDFYTFNGWSRYAGMGFTGETVGRIALLQMTDVRAQEDWGVQFGLTVDDGAYITLNQPANYDEVALNPGIVDKPGHFADMNWQGPHTTNSRHGSVMKASHPNIMKSYWIDGGGWGALDVRPKLPPSTYSLTCEAKAPFLAFEVTKRNQFEEIRNPALFRNIFRLSSAEVHYRTDERTNVPGKKGYVTYTARNSAPNLPTLNDYPILFNQLAYQSWKTMTVGFRLKSMPVNEYFMLLLNQSWFWVRLVPAGNGMASMKLVFNTKEQDTSYRISLDKWYVLVIQNKGTGYDVYCNGADELMRNGSAVLTRTPRMHQMFGTSQNENRLIMLGGTTGAMTTDVAWVHFYDYYTSGTELIREAKGDWIYTQFPDSYNNYRTLG